MPFLVDWSFSVSFVPGTLCVCNFAISRLNLERFFLVGKSSSEVLGEKIIFLWLEWFAVALDDFGVFPTDVIFLCLSNEEKGCFKTWWVAGNFLVILFLVSLFFLRFTLLNSFKFLAISCRLDSSLALFISVSRVWELIVLSSSTIVSSLTSSLSLSDAM